MQRRDDHIRRHAEHFAEQGDFIAAQKMLSAIAPTRDAWVGGRRRLLQMASEPSHLEPFMTGVTNMKVDDPFDTDLEIASLRIAGNTDKLISCAIEHTHAIVRGSTNTIVITDSMKLSVSDSNHLERAVTNSQYIIYAELAYNAVKAINKAALPVMARRLLPVFRGHLAFTDELSEALMATGDSEEAQAALNHILNSPPDNLNTQFSTQSRREDRLEGLWRLAQRIQRVNQARKNR
jgi:hypothetical protein